MNPPERIARKIVDVLSEQLDKSDFYDVTVTADDAQFNCHRVVLAAVSGFFNALLSSGMKEAIERSITLQDISKNTFSEILECVYKGKYILNAANILEVWHAANLLQILFLIEECEMFVKETLSVTNCFAMYQHSKLLDSGEITSLAWDFIHVHFDQVRLSDEILMLTAEEMKKLVSGQNLKTTSEDFVVETIFRWARYEGDRELYFPTGDGIYEAEFKHEPAPGSEDHHANKSLALEAHASDSELCKCKQDDPTEISSEQREQQRDCCDAGSRGSKGNANDLTAEDESKSKCCSGKSRAESLPDLLGAARLCLASGKCLMEITRNPLTQGNEAIQEIVELGMKYQIQPDRRHDFIPATAIQRSSSPYEILLVSGKTNHEKNFLVGMNMAGKWFSLDCSSANSFCAKKVISFDDSIICLMSYSNLWIFSPLKPNNNWKNLPEMGNSPDDIVDFFVEGHLLYAICLKGNKYFIEMLDIKNLDSAWLRVGCLGSDFGSVKCSVVVGDNVAIFREVVGNTNRIAVECFSTKTLRTQHVLDVDGPPASLVTFKRSEEGFFLLGNGSLYRVTPSLSVPPIEVKYETLLWDFDRELRGAVIYHDELLLLGPAFDSYYDDQDTKWELSVSGAFKSIRNIPCSSYYKSLTPMIFYKSGLTKRINIQ